MKEFDSPQELADELAKAIRSSETAVIGIDGTDGSGKTTLAKDIAKAIGGSLISLDDYVDEGKGYYVQHLQVAEVKVRLTGDVHPVVVEGVCLLAAAEQIGVSLTKLIYVRKVNEFGLWLDEEDCDPEEPVEQFIERRTEDYRAFVQFERDIEGKPTDAAGAVDLPELVKEIIRYHAQYRPQDRADFIFRRVDASNG